MTAKLHETRLEAAAEAAAWIAEQYATGYSEGATWAEQDQADGRGEASYWLAHFRTDYETANTRGERARMLGVLRGYRSVARTFLGGRYGT